MYSYKYASNGQFEFQYRVNHAGEAERTGWYRQIGYPEWIFNHSIVETD